MSAANTAVIRQLYDAFAVGDVPGVLGLMSPEIVWNEADDFPYADHNPYVGPQAIAEGVFARCGSEWDGFSAIPDEILDAGDTVVALGHYGGTYKATGKPQHTQFTHVWRMEGGKAVRFQQYANTLHIAQVIAPA